MKIDLNDIAYWMDGIRNEDNHMRYHMLESFWHGQLKSKIWLCETLANVEHTISNRIVIFGGWYGVLATMIFNSDVGAKHITSVDIDPACKDIAVNMNKAYAMNGKFNAVTEDMCNYEYTEDPHIVINTSCEHIENFDGKRIAAPQISNTQDVSLRHYLSANELTPVEKGGTVYVLNIANPDIYTLFAKGDIDGAWVPEPWATMLVQDLGGVRIFNESQFWPDKQFSSVLLIGRTDFIEKNPEIIHNWIKSNEETVEWINANPEKTKQLYSEFLKNYMGKTLPDEIIDESFSNLIITSDPLRKSVFTFAERADSLGYLGRSGYDINEIFYDDNISVKSVG